MVQLKKTFNKMMTKLGITETDVEVKGPTQVIKVHLYIGCNVTCDFHEIITWESCDLFSCDIHLFFLFFFVCFNFNCKKPPRYNLNIGVKHHNSNSNLSSVNYEKSSVTFFLHNRIFVLTCLIIMWKSWVCYQVNYKYTVESY